MKNRIMLLWCLVTIFLNVTAFYIIVNTVRAIYQREQIQGNYTIYMKVVDNLRFKLDQIPLLFILCLGISIGIVLMVVLRWVGWWED